jgi:hypothetical protein
MSQAHRPVEGDPVNTRSGPRDRHPERPPPPPTWPVQTEPRPGPPEGHALAFLLSLDDPETRERIAREISPASGRPATATGLESLKQKGRCGYHPATALCKASGQVVTVRDPRPVRAVRSGEPS